MPSLILTKDIEGRLCGLTEKDHAAYLRFLNHAIGMPQDESIAFSWRAPRSGPYHRRFFVMLSAVFKAQELFTDSEVMRKWAEMEAGYCEQVATPNGVVKVPKSISYESIDQIEMEDVSNKVFAFLRTEYALAVLWPHLSWEKADAMLDAVLREFDQPQSERRKHA